MQLRHDQTKTSYRFRQRRFVITHEFHPLKGCELTAVAMMAQGSRLERVVFRDELGFLRHIPSRWTDIAEPDPFREISNGRSAFRVAELLELAALITSAEAVESGSKV